MDFSFSFKMAMPNGFCMKATAPEVSAISFSLRVSRLVRGRGGYGEETLEPYHDRVREAVLEQLSEEQRRACHTRIAAALEAAGYARDQPEVLLMHQEAAGERSLLIHDPAIARNES